MLANIATKANRVFFNRTPLKRVKEIVSAMTLLALSCASVSATEMNDSKVKGLAVFQQIEQQNDGFGDVVADMSMTLKNRHGEESQRELSVKTLEVAGDGDKSLTLFNTPADVKGTALLTFTHKVGDDDQWLYLPALKRVKRISSRKKTGPFMGSEFSYEDLGSQEVEKYTYDYVKLDACGDSKCHIVNRYPIDKSSGYSKQVVWVDADKLRIEKITYYDRRNELLKTLVFSDYTLYLDKFWRAGRMFMDNHQNNKSTELLWTNFMFQTGLSEKDFSKNGLKRAK
jgi:outer membrane lipoprotein-sorting protein